MSVNSTINSVNCRRIWDSRGKPTIEVEITLNDGSIGRGVAPAGASRGTAEAIEIRDGGKRLGGLDVSLAINNINNIISPVIIGLEASKQTEIDNILLELDPSPTKERLGGNATIAVSLAVLNAASVHHHLPLWKYIAGASEVSLPLPEIQIFGGGAHAGRRVDIQDFMIIPLFAESFDQALEATAEIYIAAGQLMSNAGKLGGVADEGGWWPNFETNEEAIETLVKSIEVAGFRPGEEIGISLDVAASELWENGNYKLSLEDKELNSEGLAELFGRWIENYPIVSIEDPFAENDHHGMKIFTDAFGDRIQIIGDDYLVTNDQKIINSATKGICNAALIKVNQAGTVSETKYALEAAKKFGWGTVFSARSGETEDVTLAHLAVGYNAGQLKVGSFSRSERMAKWNEILRISEQMGDNINYIGRNALSEKTS